MKATIPICLALSLAVTSTHGAQPIETGKVDWLRQLDQALKSSASSDKPVFLLFQEVPGCAGCKQFGEDVLSHPLVVEAIETEFVPLLIHNNKGGEDARVLKQFKEPAWNYQVVRFLDASGRDLIPRKDRVWKTGPLAIRMVAALEKAGRDVPPYLELLADEANPDLKRAAFAMHCFWEGEARLGALDGVVATEAGWIGRREVTQVAYDPARLPLADLIAAAQKLECAHAVYLPGNDGEGLDAAKLKIQPLAGYRRSKDSDQKIKMKGTPVARLKLEEAQATKVNAWIRRDREKALQFLSLAQRKQLEPGT